MNKTKKFFEIYSKNPCMSISIQALTELLGIGHTTIFDTLRSDDIPISRHGSVSGSVARWQKTEPGIAIFQENSKKQGSKLPFGPSGRRNSKK